MRRHKDVLTLAAGDGEAVRVRRVWRQGRLYLDIRLWTTSPSGKSRPTKKGLLLPVGVWHRLAPTILQEFLKEGMRETPWSGLPVVLPVDCPQAAPGQESIGPRQADDRPAMRKEQVAVWIERQVGCTEAIPDL